MSNLNDVKDVKPLDDFNWDEFENGTASAASKEELEKAYDNTLNKIQEHEVVEGTVTSIDKKDVVVNIGYKSDGIIPASEFRYNPDLKVGDKVEVYVEDQEDKRGQLVLSHKKPPAMRRTASSVRRTGSPVSFSMAAPRISVPLFKDFQ